METIPLFSEIPLEVRGSLLELSARSLADNICGGRNRHSFHRSRDLKKAAIALRYLWRTGSCVDRSAIAFEVNHALGRETTHTFAVSKRVFERELEREKQTHPIFKVPKSETPSHPVEVAAV